MAFGPAIIISLIGLCLTVLIALITVTFKSGSIVANLRNLEKQFQEAIAEVDKLNKELSTLREQYSKVATLESAVNELKGVVGSLTSKLGDITTQVALLKSANEVLSAQVGSVKAMRRVSPSKPDLGG